MSSMRLMRLISYKPWNNQFPRKYCSSTCSLISWQITRRFFIAQFQLRLELHRQKHTLYFRRFVTTISKKQMTEAEYEIEAEKTLINLYDYLDTFPEWLSCHSDFDISLAMGVLTINLGGSLGIYVLNKQTPNKQIWLSSPISGPKRYDLIDDDLIYAHDSVSLYSLLNDEFRRTFSNDKIDFRKTIDRSSL